MLKIGQPGFPCTPKINDYFYGDGHVCIRGVLGGMANDECNCCTHLNGMEFYWSIFGAGSYTVNDYGQVCKNFFLLGEGGAYTVDPTREAIDCECLTGTAGGLRGSMFTSMSEFHCTAFNFHLNLWFHQYENPLAVPARPLIDYVMAWGWFDPNGDSYTVTDKTDLETAKEGIRVLMEGGTFRIYSLEDVFTPQVPNLCDTTGSYLDLSLVTCPTPTSGGGFDPSVDCENCADFAGALGCIGVEILGGHLALGGFEDCQEVTPISIINKYWSELNGDYEVEFREAINAFCSGFAGGLSSPNYWDLRVGISPYEVTFDPSEYGDLGIVIRSDDFFISPLTQWPSPTYTYHVQTIVHLVFCASGCWPSNAYGLGYVGYAYQEYIVIKLAGEVVYFTKYTPSNFCYPYYQGDADRRRDECVSIDPCKLLGFAGVPEGSVTAEFDYARCDVIAPDYGTFKGTLTLTSAE